MGYPEQLQAHLEERPYRDETITTIGRMCRVGRISEQTALEFLETLEADRRATDCEMRGMSWPDGAEDFDRVFYPGQIGGVVCRPSSLEWE